MIGEHPYLLVELVGTGDPSPGQEVEIRLAAHWLEDTDTIAGFANALEQVVVELRK